MTLREEVEQVISITIGVSMSIKRNAPRKVKINAIESIKNEATDKVMAIINAKIDERLTGGA
jgi:hypothetical protein